MLGRRIPAVGAEVTQAHKLVGTGGLCFFQAGFHLAAGKHFQRVRIQASKEILSGSIGVGIVKEVAVLANFRIAAVVGIY